MKKVTGVPQGEMMEGGGAGFWDVNYATYQTGESEEGVGW